jgi:predicted phosphodiesterase
MRLYVLSDLHLEFGRFDPPKLDYDVVALAGDIHVGLRGLEWIAEKFPHTPVLYVLGNHEFYRETWPDLIEALRERCTHTHIHVLENRAIELCGFTFLGCTLWTDFSLMGAERNAAAQTEAAVRLTDYHLMYFGPERRLVRPSETAQCHAASRQWLERELAARDPRRTIVVTHHAPSERAIPPFHPGELLNAAFASNLEALIARSGVPLWIYGHTHYSDHFRIGATQVLSNQRGYAHALDPRFNPELVLDL